jgi:hypothetical protein
MRMRIREKADGMNRQDSALWNGKRERVALLLAEGKAIKAAAAEAGIGERTAYTWLADPRFQNHISDLRGRMVDTALGRLTDAATKAVDTLVGLLDDGRDTVRLRAAFGILDSMARLREHVEFERRIAALEADHESDAQDTDRAPRRIASQATDEWSDPD